MKIEGIRQRWRWLLPALAVLIVQIAKGQGTIVYVHAPLSNPNGEANHLPWDSLGTQVGSDYSIVINGQTVLTLAAPLVAGQPSGVVVQPSSLSGVIAFQPNLVDNPLDPTALVVPLTAGQQIGVDAAGYSWLGNILGGDILTSARDGGIIGQPPVTVGYFTGLESAFFGFQFQDNGNTYYGWARVGCPVAEINAGWIYDYAYETTPNTPIFAGAGVVPEPSTFALCGVGVIMLCLWQRRKT